MKQHYTRLLPRVGFSALLIAGTAAAQVAPPQPAPRPASPPSGGAQGNIVELSPFTVTTDADAGWVASSSLAGSRLNTPLRDTGASISVLTSEFLADIGATDLTEAVDYAVNIHMTETRPGSTNDNFVLEFFDVGRMSIRGVPATATRNYYRWRMQSDAYNVDRVEENRGPNSILFGIGSAGGVVNVLTKQASLARDFREATVMGGSEDSYRGTLDVNQRLLDDRLALRLNAVHSHMGSYRQHDSSSCPTTANMPTPLQR